MKFPTREKYRDVLRDWAVRREWDLKFQHNETKKITATCKHGCDWRFHAFQVMKTTTFQIKSIKGQRTCAYKIENKKANYKYLGKRIENIIRDDPNEGLISLKNKIRRDIEVDCSLHKVYRAKRGQLLTAVGRDENDDIYPIAMAYVEIEKYDSSINYHRLNVDDYVDTYLKKEIDLKVYSHMINPVHSMHDSERSTLGKVDPPSLKSKIPTPNSQNPFSQSEPLFPLDEIPAPNSQNPFSHSEPLFPLDEVPQTSQFMESTQASQSKTTEIPTPNSQNPFSQSEPSFPLDEIPAPNSQNSFSHSEQLFPLDE
ncbi:UNVERIFIED_CONTAM: hypothetical protein Sradi_4016000, partial [Sesamum radiatum]